MLLLSNVAQACWLFFNYFFLRNVFALRLQIRKESFIYIFCIKNPFVLIVKFDLGSWKRMTIGLCALQKDHYFWLW